MDVQVEFVSESIRVAKVIYYVLPFNKAGIIDLKGSLRPAYTAFVKIAEAIDH